MAGSLNCLWSCSMSAKHSSGSSLSKAPMFSYRHITSRQPMSSGQVTQCLCFTLKFPPLFRQSAWSYRCGKIHCFAMTTRTLSLRNRTAAILGSWTRTSSCADTSFLKYCCKLPSKDTSRRQRHSPCCDGREVVASAKDRKHNAWCDWTVKGPKTQQIPDNPANQRGKLALYIMCYRGLVFHGNRKVFPPRKKLNLANAL